VLGSGGTFPVSVAVHGDLVYVLNALNGGSVQGYRVLGSFLVALPGSHRALGLDPNATPQFTTTPGQVAFTADGSQLCTEYLAQMRETIRLTGRLEPEDLTPQMREEFTDLYRRWRSEQQ